MNRSRGFTLVELMLAVGIVGILATLSIGMGTDMLHRQDVNGVSRQMYSALSRARAEAVRQNRLMTVLFEEKQVRVFVDTNRNNTYEDGETSIYLFPTPNVDRDFPPDVSINAEKPAVFNASGFSIDSGDLTDGTFSFAAFTATLTDSRGTGRTINVESTIAGAIRILDVTPVEEED